MSKEKEKEKQVHEFYLARHQPDVKWISQHLTPVSVAENKHRLDFASSQLGQNAQFGVRVYYLDHILKDPIRQIPRMLADVPLIATSGDKNIITQSGKQASSLQKALKYDPHLLSYADRRLARKKVIVSNSWLFAKGGYKTAYAKYDQPLRCIIVTAAGAQFEMPQLEGSHFIAIKPSNPDAKWFIPKENQEFQHYYPAASGLKQWIPESAQTQGYDHLFLNEAFYRSCLEDAYLILTAFDDQVRERGGGKKGWFKFVAIGMGFFADLWFGGSLMEFLSHTYLRAIGDILKTHRFANIAVLEFPDFLKGQWTPEFDSTETLKIIKGVENKRDLLDFSEKESKQYILGVLNAGDCFCIPGNEFDYASVEAMIGNNTDIRTTQSYIFNPYLMNPANYRGVRRTSEVIRLQSKFVPSASGSGVERGIAL